MKSKKIAGCGEGGANCERGRPGKIVPTTWIAKMSQPPHVYQCEAPLSKQVSWEGLDYLRDSVC